jgi:hypothetical protein
MKDSAVVETLEAISASAAAMAVAFRQRTEYPGQDGADPLREQADAFLDGLTGVAGMEAQLAAVRVHCAAGYAGTGAAMAPPAASPQEHTAQVMSVTAEVACALTISERSAGALLDEAHALTTLLPLTLAALQAGTVSWPHARVMCDETTGLEPAAAAALEAHFLDPAAADPARGCPAGDLTPGRFRAKARTWRERHHPVSIETRHRKSAADRRLEYIPDRDGMAWLSAYLPADAAASIWQRSTAAARALQGPAEQRNLSQLRADTAAAWLLAGVAEGVPSPNAQVLVTVPALSLLGATEEPAVLDGYGPIPPSMARRLVADGAASFHRVLTEPGTGAPLEIGRTSYRITAAMRQWLRLRDGKCPFPGCNNQSLDTEADHVLAWHKGGATGISNLGQPCRKHHRLRHTTGWKPIGASRDAPPGWVAPSGRRYFSERYDWEPPWMPAATAGPPGIAHLADGTEHAQGTDPPQRTDHVTGADLPVDPLPDWETWIAA